MSKDRDWVDELIALGIGALAAYFLIKILSPEKEGRERIVICPYCRQTIKKWAIQCPHCRTRLRGGAPFTR